MFSEDSTSFDLCGNRPPASLNLNDNIYSVFSSSPATITINLRQHCAEPGENNAILNTLVVGGDAGCVDVPHSQNHISSLEYVAWDDEDCFATSPAPSQSL